MSDEGPDLELAKRYHDRHWELFKALNEAVVNSGTLAVRSLMLINGGAVVALLAFVSSLVKSASDSPTVQMSQLASPLTWFAFGVFAAVVSMGFAFFANLSSVTSLSHQKLVNEHPYTSDTPISRRWLRSYTVFQVAAILTALASAVLFLCGVFESKSAILLIYAP